MVDRIKKQHSIALPKRRQHFVPYFLPIALIFLAQKVIKKWNVYIPLEQFEDHFGIKTYIEPIVTPSCFPRQDGWKHMHDDLEKWNTTIDLSCISCYKSWSVEQIGTFWTAVDSALSLLTATVQKVLVTVNDIIWIFYLPLDTKIIVDSIQLQ